MGLLLLLIFVGVGLAEFQVFGIVVDAFSGQPLIPIAILVADSIFGALLVKQEGTRAWKRFVSALGSGTAPAEQVIDGALILFGGALLLTPGFITDLVGVICVLGPTRSVLNKVLIRRFSLASGPLGMVFRSLPGSGVRAARSTSRRARREGAAGRGSAAGGPLADDLPPRGSDVTPPRGKAAPPPPGVIDVEVVEVKRNRPKDAGGT